MTRFVLTKLVVALTALSLSLSLAATAWAQEGSETAAAGDDLATGESAQEDAVLEEVIEEDEEADASVSTSSEEEDAKGWGVNANAGLSLGIGAFASNEYVRRNRLRYNMGFGGNYTIPVIDVSVGLSTGFSQWLTEAGGSQEVQEFRWSDTSLSLSRSVWTIPVVDVNISASLDAMIPTSTSSRAMGQYTALSPSLSFSTKAGPVGFSYSASYGYNFYKYTSVTFDPKDVDILSRSGGNEVVASDVIAEGGVLPEMSMGHRFGVSYSILDQLKFSVGFGFSDAWTYDNGSITQEDEFTAENADTGRGHSQMTNGSIGLSYTPFRYLTASLSLSSSQPWKTADNQGYRFPFFDFEGTANNFTNIRFGLSGRY